MTWHRRHDMPWLAAFVLPAFLIVVAVQFYPLAYSGWLSVQEWSLTKSQQPEGFVGLANFIDELGDETFRRSVRNSALITGGAVLLEMILGVCLAYLTMGASWRMRAVRTILILPMVIAPVAAGTLWRILAEFARRAGQSPAEPGGHQRTGVAGFAGLGDRLRYPAGYLAMDALCAAGGGGSHRQHPA